MEPQKSFYVTLPSNVSSPSYHENKTSHFITHLPKPIEVRDYEVALCEICYPHSFDNIYGPINKIIFEAHIGSMSYVRRYRSIIPSYYQSVEDVVKAINEQKPSEFKGEFAFEKYGRIRVKLVLFEGEGVKLHPTLAALLGFKTHKWVAININESDIAPPSNPVVITQSPPGDDVDRTRTKRAPRMRFKAERIGDKKSLLYNIFVYSSICKESLVGNDYFPLLRTINIEGEEGQYIHKTFETPHYIRLVSDFLHRIDIRITDDQGEPVHFTYGKLIVKLHFRKISTLG